MAGFADIVGHEQIIEYMKTAARTGQVSHAYILDGPERSGKRMLADAFAMALQCEQETGEPCLECRSCRQAMHHNQPDILPLLHEKPNTISVDDIRRQINREIGNRPYSSRYRVFLIDEAEKMNVQAQNALLKTLEEPPSYAVILLLTTNSDSFLPTIRSRCVNLRLKAVPDEQIRRLLMTRYQVPDYKAALCAGFAQGNVGRAVELAQSDSFQNLKDQTAGLLSRIGTIRNYRMAEIVRQFDDWKDQTSDLLDMIRMWYRDVLYYKTTGKEDGFIFLDCGADIIRQSEQCTCRNLQLIFEAVDRAQRRIRSNTNRELTLELLFMTIKENIE